MDFSDEDYIPSETELQKSASDQEDDYQSVGYSSAAFSEVTEDDGSDFFEDEQAAFTLLEHMGNQDAADDAAVEPYLLLR